MLSSPRGRHCAGSGERGLRESIQRDRNHAVVEQRQLAFASVLTRRSVLECRSHWRDAGLDFGLTQQPIHCAEQFHVEGRLESIDEIARPF